MNGLPYYKAYPRDFIEGTIGMAFETKCAYRLVLDLIYMQGGQLPDDPRYISGLMGCSVRLWKKHRDILLEMGKIYVRDGVISNFRADKELESLAKVQERQRENRSKPNKNNDLQSPRSDHTEPDTDKEKREPKGSPKKKGCRLPEDWSLPTEWRDWAIGEGMDELGVRREAERFRDYWLSAPSAKGVKSDWQATWRNWIRKAIDDQPRKGGPRTQPQPGDTRTLKTGERQVYANPFDGWVKDYG